MTSYFIEQGYHYFPLFKQGTAHFTILPLYRLSIAAKQGIVYFTRNRNSATFFSYVCNAKKIEELFHPT